MNDYPADLAAAEQQVAAAGAAYDVAAEVARLWRKRAASIPGFLRSYRSVGPELAAALDRLAELMPEQTPQKDPS